MGGITGNIDLAQIAIYVFWAFFIGLVIYLQRESHREGYPLESDPGGAVDMRGSFLIPKPKIYRLRNGETRSVPRYDRDTRPLAVRRAAPWPGAPMIPTGNPLVDGVGPAAWADRPDVPDLTWNNEIKIVPSRLAPEFYVSNHDPDPTGFPVIAADGLEAGTVAGIWIDRSEHVIRYLEVDSRSGTGPLLVPLTLAKLNGETVKVKALLAAQFADAPRTRSPDQVTLLEEDRIYAYFAGGHLYATPSRAEPLL